MLQLQLVASLLALTLSRVAAHGSHGHTPSGLNWGELHMLEEHHIGNFDPGAFFSLHDFDKSGSLSRDEMLRTYGLGEENVEVTPEKKNEVAKELFRLIDYDRDGEISLEELKQYYKEGHVLPDFGLGPGHHGDEEYEYEIHHFEKYHSEDSPEEELNHPEDIAHFKKHEEEERREEERLKQEQMMIVQKNIPAKFRVQKT